LKIQLKELLLAHLMSLQQVSHLAIVGEVTLPVSFALMIKGDDKEILRIATHPHAEAQCRNFVATNYPDAELIATASTAAAAEAISRGEFDAAIAAPVAAAHYGLRVIADNIGDNVGAVTRFILVSKPGSIPKNTGWDRTSLGGLYWYRPCWCTA